MAKRCFFSFHYQDVIDFRANVVRNHNITKDDNGGFFDASIWESAKKTGESALKRLINDGLNNTSMTVVLIGSQTYSRRWVQYEIMKSIERGNGVLGIHINSIKDRNGIIKTLGPNPFNYLGVHISQDGNTASPTILVNGKWEWYQDVSPYKLNNAQPLYNRGRHLQLDTFFKTYDWVVDDGFNNFKTWIT